MGIFLFLTFYFTDSYLRLRFLIDSRFPTIWTYFFVIQPFLYTLGVKIMAAYQRPHFCAINEFFLPKSQPSEHSNTQKSNIEEVRKKLFCITWQIQHGSGSFSGDGAHANVQSFIHFDFSCSLSPVLTTPIRSSSASNSCRPCWFMS